MILVDTSVWIEHLRRRHGGLAKLLEQGQVVVHPFVIGEIALGVLKQRNDVLGLLSELPAASVARHDEVIELVGRHRLAGAGIGWVDMHLLASTLLDRRPLWTLDRRLSAVAQRLGSAWTA
jgi:predicted nucleic acid-binding protein